MMTQLRCGEPVMQCFLERTTSWGMKVVIVLLLLTIGQSAFAEVASENISNGSFHTDGNLNPNAPTSDVGDRFSGPGGSTKVEVTSLLAIERLCTL